MIEGYNISTSSYVFRHPLRLIVIIGIQYHPDNEGREMAPNNRNPNPTSRIWWLWRVAHLPRKKEKRSIQAGSQRICSLSWVWPVSGQSVASRQCYSESPSSEINETKYGFKFGGVVEFMEAEVVQTGPTFLVSPPRIDFRCSAFNLRCYRM